MIGKLSISLAVLNVDNVSAKWGFGLSVEEEEDFSGEVNVVEVDVTENG